jgi:hypothetical protein
MNLDATQCQAPSWCLLALRAPSNVEFHVSNLGRACIRFATYSPNPIEDCDISGSFVPEAKRNFTQRAVTISEEAEL